MESNRGSRGDTSSQDLVRRIQDGDREAFDEVYRRYHDPLLLAIRARLSPALRSRVGSEDILHSVFCAALRSKRAFAGFEAGSTGSLARYLVTGVLNKIRSKGAWFSNSKRGGDARLSDSIIASVPDEAASLPRYRDATTYERLERALADLPADMREVVLLRRIEELTNQEAALRIGRSEDATAKLYQRALARIGVRLGATRETGRDRV